MSGGRKEEGRTSGETAGRKDERREEGGRKNQRGNRWTWGRAEGGRRKEEPAGKPLDVGTSGERGA